MQSGVFLILVTPLFAQPGTITTAAGAYPLGDGGPARQAALFSPRGIARDPAGNLYIADEAVYRIRKISPDGIITTFAGNGTRRAFDSPAIDGPAAFVPIDIPRDAATDSAGNVYFIDFNLIRKVTPDGLVKTVAGKTTPPGVIGVLFSGDGGPATNANLRPLGLAVDNSGNIYISDTLNGRIRKVDASGIITTIAGAGGPGIPEGSSGDGGPARNAQVAPQSIAIDAAGNVYFGDRLANTIRRIGVDGNITAVAQNVNVFGGIVVDTAGNVYFLAGGQIRRLTPAGAVEAVAGNQAGSTADGAPALQTKLNQAADLVTAPDGSVYFTEGGSRLVRQITPRGTVVTVGGASAIAGDGGPGVYARVSNAINQLSIDPSGNVLIVDGTNYRIRRLSADGILASVAGNGFGEFLINADAPVATGGIGIPIGVTSDTQGNLFIVNSFNFVFRISGDGVLRRFATLNGNGGMATDAAGNLYVVEASQHRVRRIAPDGTVSTFAGTGVAGFTGDGGPAARAQLSSPRSVAVAPNGDVYIADTSNNRIRRVSAAGTISTVAGGGVFGSVGAGPALQVFISPRWLALDAKGNLFFTDIFQVKKLTPGGAVSIAAGVRRQGFAGDGGPATQALFNDLEGIAVDPNGNLFIADAGNRRIRRVEGSSPFAFTPRALLYAFALGAPAARQTLTISSFDGDQRPFRLEANVPWLAFAPANGNVAGPLAIAVTANPAGLVTGAYAAQIRIIDTRTGELTLVPVTMTISRTPQQLRLSQVGLTFAAREGGAAPPAQSFQVINSGVGSMGWTTSVSTLDAGPGWLTATPSNGTSVAGTSTPAVNVSINPQGLAAGVYHGLVTATAAGADNSPQSAVVLLNLLPANQQPGPVVDPTGLIFTAAPGGTNPPPQSIRLSNISGRAVNFQTAVDLRGGPNWFTRVPVNGAIQPGQGASIEIRSALGNIAAGAYPAELAITFTPDNVTVRAAVLLVVSAGVSSAAKGAQADCAATRLLPVLRTPGLGFAVSAGWPTPIEVQVVDDCGQPLTAGGVSAEFSTGDSPLIFSGAGAGRWSATWAARGIDAGVRITVRAESATGVRGQTEITGGVRDTPNQPAVSKGGVVNAASFRTFEPLAPGSYVSIFGSKLSAEVKLAESLPLPVQLADTMAVLGGRPLPLNLTSDGQVNAILPYEVADNTTQQLIVRRGRAYSLPEPVLTATAQPAVFTIDGSGGGQGHIYVFTPEGYILADASRPAKAADVLLMYVTGMGPVDVPVRAGEAAPSDPLARVRGQVRVTVQGLEARILFAGLAPGFAGVYQVNIVVPERIKADAAGAVVVEVGGQAAAAVTMALGERVVE